ncbi:MAG: hypothetical protein Wins2KO_24630 [Winogradskyella sp.]
MKSAKNLLSLILCCALIIFSCQQDDTPSQNNNDDPQENIPDTFSEYFGNEISRDFLGSVIDSNHNPIEGVTVSIGSETAMTDSNGVFIIRDASVNERFGYVKAEKVGYIHASRSVVPSNGTNKVTIMMLEETVAGSVNSGSSSTITTDDGSSVNFDGNFIKEDGTAYSGSVDVIVHHLDPTDEDIELQMPGMLYAQNENGAERMLQTLGMLAVELRGSGDEDLNLAEGSTSEIRIPVDDSLLSTAPATIPLWYFDEATGYWKEEGIATLQGNMYVSTVSHFSYWSLNTDVETVNLCINLVDENNNPIPNQFVSLLHTDLNYFDPTSFGITNNEGEFCLLVPINITSEFKVASANTICGSNVLHSEIIGPFNEDTSISVIMPSNNPNYTLETVTGTFTTCNGEAITNGYVNLTYGYQTVVDFVTDGNFEINLIRCTDEDIFTIRGSDYDNLETTGDISFSFTTPQTNIGNLTACNNITEFITYTIGDGEPVYFLDFTFRYHEDGLGLTYNPYLTLDVSSSGCYSPGSISGLGTFDDELTSYYDTGIKFIECLYSEEYHWAWTLNSLNSFDLTYTVTSIGEVGEHVDMIFSGSVEDDLGVTHAVNGVFHVIRDQ